MPVDEFDASTTAGADACGRGPEAAAGAAGVSVDVVRSVLFAGGSSRAACFATGSLLAASGTGSLRSLCRTMVCVFCSPA